MDTLRRVGPLKTPAAREKWHLRSRTALVNAGRDFFLIRYRPARPTIAVPITAEPFLTKCHSLIRRYARRKEEERERKEINSPWNERRAIDPGGGTRLKPCPGKQFEDSDIGPLTSQAGGSRVGRDNEISPVANLFPNSRGSGGVKQPFWTVVSTITGLDAV